MMLKLHSMVILQPEGSHARGKSTNPKFLSTFGFEKYWMVNSDETLKDVMRKLTNRTQKDKLGRILCYGRVRQHRETQHRLFVVKLGHDGKIWSTTTDRMPMIYPYFNR